MVQRLNFHHLRYFWAVAKAGNLTRAAKTLRVSQSALSTQIRQLEQELGEPLFHREGRRLTLTEAGKITHRYADEIFASGGELLATLKDGRRRQDVFRVGAVTTLSRNFQLSFLKLAIEQPSVVLRMQSGGIDQLLSLLETHALDVVLSNRPVPRAPGRTWRCRLIARQPVSIVGRPRAKRFRFPHDLSGARMILPGSDSFIRAEFDALCERLGVQPAVIAEVDDMATMRLLARDVDALALLPSVVVRDELHSGALREHCVVPNVSESFYAITVERQFQHPLVKSLLAQHADDILAMDEE
jgi:LysR family transcriptional activator of nhaA